MSTERKGVELFVGLFLLLGFGVIATMVLMFGRLGKGFQKTYPITVEFSNASGQWSHLSIRIIGPYAAERPDNGLKRGLAYAPRKIGSSAESVGDFRCPAEQLVR